MKLILNNVKKLVITTLLTGFLTACGDSNGGDDGANSAPQFSSPATASFVENQRSALYTATANGGTDQLARSLSVEDVSQLVLNVSHPTPNVNLGWVWHSPQMPWSPLTWTAVSGQLAPNEWLSWFLVLIR